MAQSWNFIGGLAGYPSFATAAFSALALNSAILQNHGVPMVLAWGSAGLAALLRPFSAVPSCICAATISRLQVSSSPRCCARSSTRCPTSPAAVKASTCPSCGFPSPRRRNSSFTPCSRLAILCTGAAIVIHRSKLGFGLRCIQQNEDAASILGVNTYGYKTAAFCLSAVFVGVAGAIYASWVNYIDPPDVFDVLLAIKPMVMVLLGGLGTIFGPSLGAVILLTFEELV